MTYRVDRTTVMQEKFITAVKATGVSYAEIARRIGSTPRYVAELMSGYKHGSLPMWADILESLSIEVGTRQLKREES